VADCGEWRGIGSAGTAGAGPQMWSPSSSSGTGLLQFEHFTDGSTCEIRPGGALAGCFNNCAIGF
jgi:hypothetical protein